MVKASYLPVFEAGTIADLTDENTRELETDLGCEGGLLTVVVGKKSASKVLNTGKVLRARGIYIKLYIDSEGAKSASKVLNTGKVLRARGIYIKLYIDSEGA